MAKTYVIQNSFTGGEISPRLLGRTDLQQYQNSVREMYNCYPFLHGGVTRRKGTRYVWSLPTVGSAPPKLIKFVYSRTVSYLLVIHDGKMYFVQNGAMVETGGTPISLTIPWSDAELDELRWSQQGNIMIFAHPNHPPKRLARTSPTSFSLTDISFVQYAVGDYWYRTEPIDIKIVSDSDIDTNYNVGQYWEWTTSGTSVTVNPALKNAGGSSVSSPPGACVITRVSGSGGDGVWTATCVYSDSDRTEWLVETPNATFPTLTWATGNYPQTVTFYQQRLWFGGAPDDPQTIWGSKIADYENFTLGPEDDDAVQFTIASGNFDPIVHLSAASQSLLPLTYSTEYLLSGNNTSITPSNVFIAAQTYHGANDVHPLTIGTDTLFVQRDGKKVRAIFFDINQSQNLAKDLTLFAEHITGDGIIDAAFAQDPDYIVWGVREDGNLISITYQRDESVTGWAEHNLTDPAKSVAVVPETDNDAVYIALLRTQAGGDVYTIETFGDQYLDSYQTYAAVNGTITNPTITAGTEIEINGVVVMAPDTTLSGLVDEINAAGITGVVADDANNQIHFYIETDSTGAIDLTFANSGYAGDLVGDLGLAEGTYTEGSATPYWTVDSRWEGMTVSIVADGFVVGTRTVVDGKFDIGEGATNITVGLNYENYVTLLHTEPETGATSQGRAMSLDKFTLRYQDTVGSYVQSTDNTQTVLPFVKFSEAFFNQATTPYTGDKTINITGWSIDNRVRIGQNAPLPWTLLAIVMRVTVNDQ